MLSHLDMRPSARTTHPAQVGGMRPWPIACRSVVIVESNDAVYARLADDLEALGLKVRRAMCASSVSRILGRFPTDLLLANVDLPDQSGWLLAAKLRLVPSPLRIWLYAAWPPTAAAKMAEYVGADAFFAYEGDASRLSAALLPRIWRLPALALHR